MSRFETPHDVGRRVQRSCHHGVERADVAAAIREDRAKIARAISVEIDGCIDVDAIGAILDELRSAS